MIKIVAVLALFLQCGLTEPPVNGYLPSSRSSDFSRNYAPPAANVSFNFGFSPRTSKMFRDSSAHEPQHSSLTKSVEPFYRSKEFLGNIDSKSNNLGKTANPVDTHIELKSHSPMYSSARSTYGLPSQRVPSSTNMPYVAYGTPSDDGLPIIEENLVQRTAQDYHQNHRASEFKPDYSARSQSGYDLSRSANGRSEIEGKSEVQSYDFSYEVMAPETGVSLGHKENHDGSSAEGVYHNLLPDGRLLTVEYWADEDGFKPRLSYKTLHSSKSENAGPY